MRSTLLRCLLLGFLTTGITGPGWGEEGGHA